MLFAPQDTPPRPIAQLDSVFEMVVAGGPVMIPLALCSLVALTCAFERALRLRARSLGIAELERELLPALASGGATAGLALLERHSTPAARVLRAGLSRWDAPYLEREKELEEAGLREVRGLSANLKPLVYVAMLAPLLGFLGTVYGMIVAFSTVALSEGLGRPELLAAGISQALVTTAAGLTIAVPTQVLYYWLKSRVERFARNVEELWERSARTLRSGVTPPPATPSAPPVAEPLSSAAQPA